MSLLWLGARCSLMRSVIYDRSDLGQVWDPLEWFLFDTPPPCPVLPHPTLGSVSWVRLGVGPSRVDITCLHLLANQSQMPVPFPKCAR